MPETPSPYPHAGASEAPASGDGVGARPHEASGAVRAREDGERREAALFANLPGMAYRRDPEPPWALSFASDGAHALTGRRAESLVAHAGAWSELVHQGDRDRVAEALASALAAGRAFSIEHRIVHADGSERWVLDRGCGVHGPQGELAAIEGLVVDLTEQRRRELALEDADHRKDELIAMVAHELRGPLTPMRNALSLLERGLPPERDQAQVVEILVRQADGLARLVDDLLDLSRVSRNRIELRREPTDMVAVLGRGLDAATKPLSDRRLHLTTNLPRERVMVLGDAVRLEQIVGNLVTNAIKYTDAGGRITVSLERSGPMVVLRVRDTGIGIEPAYLPRIFDLFQQAERSLARSQGGLGIGLSVTKTLVEMHGGTIEAHSEGLGRGSELVVRLPAHDPPPVPSPAPAQVAGVRRRVLVVDDNPDNADTLADLLALMGHDVRVARDGLEALALAAAFRPELVLLDIGLPGLDGYEVTRRLRRESWGMHATVVAVTGYGQASDRTKSFEAGFDEHVVKPIKLDVLATIVTSAAHGRPPRPGQI